MANRARDTIGLGEHLHKDLGVRADPTGEQSLFRLDSEH